MIAFMDCCHSGTMLDLKGTEANCRVVAFSGCQDHQTSNSI